uniref:Nucleoprotein n=1 Tax=Sciadopitys virus 1_Chi TaxID=2977987 RepID=A0A9N7AAN2_9RHAB|nr:TPA_asm: nucleocapsid protein [Sciadopitys virus 1_Chi]
MTTSAPSPPAPPTSVGLTIKSRYSAATTNFSASGVSKTDWTDSQLSSLEGFKLITMSEKDLCKEVKDLIPKLETGISERSAGRIIGLAWNLLCPGKKFQRVFPDKNDCQKITSSDITSLDDTVISQGSASSNIAWGKSDLETCQAGAYICAALLRLFTKSPDNFKTAQQEIKNSFQKFYQVTFPITPFTVRDAVITDLHSLYQNISIFRSSLAGLLYHFQETTDGQGVATLTFELHLQNTGMHVWPMFQDVCGSLHASSIEMLSALDIKATRKALDCILAIIVNFEGAATTLQATDRARKTYKYSRIYDKNMFADIQTKNCRPLALILGNLKKMSSPRGTGDVLDMVALKNIDQDIKDMYKKFAKGIYDHFMASEEAAGGNEIFLKVMT